MAEINQTIIIKKIKKGGDGHHGGAWKVAYADFVTAMMAFFLLLWLLSSTSESTKEGIAEYFTPTYGLKDAMGIGFRGGLKPTEDGRDKDNMTPPGITEGRPQQGPVPNNHKEALIEADKEANLFEKAEEAIKQAFESDPNLRELRDQIIVEQTPEGLKIQIVDADRKEMFEPGTAVLNEYGKRILRSLLKVIEQMPNYISITGHTDATPYSRGNGYTNWELSADRANASRRYLLAQGMNKERTGKVVGRADQELLTPLEPTSPRNRRIAIILLRGTHLPMPFDMLPAPRSLLTVPGMDVNGLAKPIPQPTRNAPATTVPVPQATPSVSPASPVDAIVAPSINPPQKNVQKTAPSSPKP
ncbi:MAG: flagellar motor protein MotB [Rickettsiales bacterium]|nr:flagellar motor protein MotB [Rickettsiales bacterium]